MSKTALIILNYNNIEDTIKCIESVERYNSAPIKLIVIDNGSSREDAARLLGIYLHEHYKGKELLHINDNELRHLLKTKTVLPYVTYIESVSNDGYSAGNNKGLLLANCDEEIDFVMVLNNDVLFVEDIIPSLYQKYTELPNVAILSPILYKRDMTGFDGNCARLKTSFKAEVLYALLHHFYQTFHHNDPVTTKRYLDLDKESLPEVMDIDLPSGSCMFINKTLFSSIGFFDPNVFLYHEEDILYKKVERAGKHNYLLTNLRCIHLGAQSTSKQSRFKVNHAGYKSLCYYMSEYEKLPWWKYQILIASLKISVGIGYLKYGLKIIFRKQ